MDEKKNAMPGGKPDTAQEILQRITILENWKSTLEERFGKNFLMMDACRIEEVVSVIQKRIREVPSENEDEEFLWQNPKLENAEVACLDQICNLLGQNGIPTKETAEIVKLLAEAAFMLERTVELIP